MKDDSIRVLKTVKYSAIGVGMLTVAGILTVSNRRPDVDLFAVLRTSPCSDSVT